MPKNAEIFSCEKCDFVCSKMSNYNKHLSTAKHNWIIASNCKSPLAYTCECGKTYSYNSGLCKHKKKCSMKKATITDHVQNTKDELIERLVKELNEERNEKKEIKSMFMLMMEKYQEMQIQNQENTRDILKETAKGTQELVNKVIEVIPQMGNTTNNNTTNNTLNFYLTNTCRNAETIHDFTDRFVGRSVDFFKENFRDVARNQISLPSNIYDTFFSCLSENPQYNNFIQTTDVKNGILYVKERKKDENRELCGEAEFVKYMDGFEKAGLNISHAIHKAFVPLQTDFDRIFENECGEKPCEEDYENEDEYEVAQDKYNETLRDMKRHLLLQICNTTRLFDSKTHKEEILSKTKRMRS